MATEPVVHPQPFTLAPDLNIAELARAYREQGRVRIHGFLADATGLRNHLEARSDWRHVINSGDKVYELDRDTRAAFTDERRAALDAAVFGGAAHGFQFRYETIRVDDEEHARLNSGKPLDLFADWLSRGEARALLRTICATPDIAFADAQATAFRPGDFLTGHDDEVAGKHRHAAYVLGLTPGWRLEWGGLLLFHDREGDGFAGRVPGFNTLDVFAVPQPHSVSLVSPAAPEPRLSVTGWLRSHHA